MLKDYETYQISSIFHPHEKGTPLQGPIGYGPTFY
jgi:hypothetical protein